MLTRVPKVADKDAVGLVNEAGDNGDQDVVIQPRCVPLHEPALPQKGVLGLEKPHLRQRCPAVEHLI